MKNNKTIKNMELILLEIRKNVLTKDSDTRVSKALINSYLTLLKEFERMDEKERVSFASHLGAQASQLNIISHHIKEVKMNESFNSSDYVGINNYATILDKVSQALLSIGNPDTCSYEPSTIIEELLDMSVQTGTLVTFYDESHRGMGKTTALVKKAHELDALLVAGLRSRAEDAEEIASKLGLDITVIANFREASLPQYRENLKKSGYLVDELVDREELRKFSTHKLKLLGGFTRILI